MQTSGKIYTVDRLDRGTLHLLPAVSVAAFVKLWIRRGGHFARTVVICLCMLIFYLRVQPAVQCLQGCRRDLAQRPVPVTDNGRSEIWS